MQENQIEHQRPEYDMGGLKLTFYGLLFTAINIRIQGFDIVPDLIGYIMVIVGLGRIEQYNENFSVAKKLSIVLTVFSVINIYQAPAKVDPFGMTETASSSISYSAGIFGSVAWLSVVFLIIGIIVNIYFAYSICHGLGDLLKDVGDIPLAKISDERWKLILAAELGLLFSLLLVLLQIPFGGITTVLFGILSLIALVLFLLLIHHSYHSIHGKPIGERNVDHHGE